MASISRRVMMTYPVDRSYYASHLDIQEYDQIVHFDALQDGRFSRAIGRRGGHYSPLARKLKTLRERELVEVHGLPAFPAPPLATGDDGEGWEIEEVDLTGGGAGSSMGGFSNPTMAAAATYMTQMGHASSRFVMEMTNASKKFVTDVSMVPPPLPDRGQTNTPAELLSSCAICFEAPTEPMFGVPCSHVYCKACLMHPHMDSREVIRNGIKRVIVKSCPQCRGPNVTFYRMLPPA